MSRWLKTCCATLWLIAGCDRSEPTVAMDPGALVAGLGPIPAPSPDEARMTWRWAAPYLTLWKPDPSAPPPVTDEAVINFSCAGEELIVSTSLIVWVDVNPAPPPNVFRLEGSDAYLMTRMEARSGGYTGWAGGRFRTTKADLEGLLTSRFLVARPLWVGRSARHAPDGGRAERYPAPPAPMVDALLQSCSALPA